MEELNGQLGYLSILCAFAFLPLLLMTSLMLCFGKKKKQPLSPRRAEPNDYDESSTQSHSKSRGKMASRAALRKTESTNSESKRQLARMHHSTSPQKVLKNTRQSTPPQIALKNTLQSTRQQKVLKNMCQSTPPQKALKNTRKSIPQTVKVAPAFPPPLVRPKLFPSFASIRPSAFPLIHEAVRTEPPEEIKQQDPLVSNPIVSVVTEQYPTVSIPQQVSNPEGKNEENKEKKKEEKRKGKAKRQNDNKKQKEEKNEQEIEEQEKKIDDSLKGKTITTNTRTKTTKTRTETTDN